VSRPGTDTPAGRARREPPRFLPVSVDRVEPVGPHLIRVIVAGPTLDSLAAGPPAASVRLLLPSPGTRELVVPSWSGNEFLLPDERRPAIRTFTPLPAGPGRLELDIVVHEGGVASEWAAAAQVGDQAAVSGPGRGYAIDPDATSFLLVGDETAVPAISQLLPALPAGTPVQVHIEVAHPDARIPLPGHPLLATQWHDRPPDASPCDTLVAAVRATEFDPGIRVWVAGEAAAVQRIRRHLFEDRMLPRAQATARGYWKHGRAGDAAEP
jgi:NADPH-dependent ferric siderophore reductase